MSRKQATGSSPDDGLRHPYREARLPDHAGEHHGGGLPAVALWRPRATLSSASPTNVVGVNHLIHCTQQPTIGQHWTSSSPCRGRSTANIMTGFIFSFPPS